MCLAMHPDRLEPGERCASTTNRNFVGRQGREGRTHQALMADALDRENPVLTVDLEAREITRPNGATVSFEIDEFRRECLLDGLDDIGLTMQKVDRIDAFEAAQRERQPWLYL